MFKIYCDGSCKGNGKKDSVGAWAYVILDSNNEIIWLPGLKKSKYDRSKRGNYDIILEYYKEE